MTCDLVMEIIPAPKSLQEWRYQKPHPVPGHSPRPRNVWIPLEPFFLSQGYTLWQPQFAMYPMPPNDAPRAPDGFVYRTVYCETEPNVRHFDLIVSQTSYLLLKSDSNIYLFKSTIHCPARTTDNRDVLIRLMAIGEDRGERHRNALSRVATGDNALRGTNHAVPVLRELVHEDMVFAVFPLLSFGFDYPWFYHFSEVLNAVEQVLEVTVFSNLVGFVTEFI